MVLLGCDSLLDVAVPIRGAGCIPCVLRHEDRQEQGVAVPARGAGCIVSMFDDFDIDYNQLPSPRGVRVASRKRFAFVV